MTPKEEIRAALLNTSNISEEASAFLDNILNNDSGGGTLIVEVGPTIEGGTLYEIKKTAGELLNAIREGKNIICHFPDDGYGIDNYRNIFSVRTSIDYGTKEIYSINFEVSGIPGGTPNMYGANSLDEYPSCSYD